MTPHATTAHDFTLDALRGPPIALKDYAGRPMLIVNTASLCGFTPQYAGLQQLWTEYGPQGLAVIAVPSADFGNQEHADPAQTAAVCDARFQITFPVAATAHVRGPQATPLFRWIAESAGMLGRPRWNFYKYVIGRDGRLMQWFGSVTPPTSRRLTTTIARSLAVGP